MKIFYIFLDIDGVLNNERYFMECYERHKIPGIMSCENFPFDPKCLNNLMILNQMLQKKGYKVKIVLSSTWRLGNTSVAIVNSRLAEYGMRISEKTISVGNRGVEILTFLTEAKKEKTKNYLILDDEVHDISKIFEETHIIKTSYNTGFDKEKLEEAINKIKELENASITN